MRWLAASLLILAVSACAEVKPWQRGALAHPSMDPNNRLATIGGEFNNHVFDVREGGTGCVGTAGGGCGCN